MISTSEKLREQLACARTYKIPLSEFLRWPDADQDLAIGYERYLSTVCSKCGTPRGDWEGDRFAYVADLIRCQGCETVAQASSQVPEQEQGKGVFIALLPREQAEARDEQLALAEGPRPGG